MSKKSGLTKRQKLIIEMLAAFNADNPITIQAISEKLKLSSRTVLREMPNINKWFEENDFKLVKKPRIGLYVDEDSETRKFIKELVDMDENKPVYSKADRQTIILLDLLTINEPLKYFYFTSLFHISDATLSNDLEEIEKWLDHYNLILYRKPGMGIYWEGKEEDYRQAVTMILRQKLRGRSLNVLFEEEKKIKERMFPDLTPQLLERTKKVVDICRRFWIFNIQTIPSDILEFTYWLQKAELSLDMRSKRKKILRQSLTCQNVRSQTGLERS